MVCLPSTTPHNQPLHWTPNRYGNHRADVGSWRFTQGTRSAFVEQLAQYGDLPQKRVVEFVGRYDTMTEALRSAGV